MAQFFHPLFKLKKTVSHSHTVSIPKSVSMLPKYVVKVVIVVVVGMIFCVESCMLRLIAFPNHRHHRSHCHRMAASLCYARCKVWLWLRTAGLSNGWKKSNWRLNQCWMMTMFRELLLLHRLPVYSLPVISCFRMCFCCSCPFWLHTRMNSMLLEEIHKRNRFWRFFSTRS